MPFYGEHSIDVNPGTRAAHLDADQQIIQTDQAGAILQLRFRPDHLDLG